MEIFTNYQSHWIMAGLLLTFAIAHSGLAALRSRMEELIGARAYRVLFALVSLTLAVVMIIYFFNHRYDGVQLWQVQAVPGIKIVVSALSVISFVFLYPATFNLLEVAAIAKPQVHLFETGIIRIARHPQMVGQIIWCIAHTLWIGSSFMVVTSLGLILHHLFGVWHGDRRLAKRYGDAFAKVKERTSIIPFKAIWEGRQELKLEEFLTPAYLGVAFTIVGFRMLHPLMFEAAAKVPW
ncbi:NnrU family protein [Thalassoporum mexicanum PCC 7367]|uniref:NnrU family protein n=1 Tax=Thalassoporum mexicanum TaxID=3457544 RepID=UPI00029F894B|nr:NnrU family protein [Pseudanabaena sp. PCC 7367]AFY70243.1 NnrU family protein [Pseudanabaena sp. PCC 7367]